eukprot:TRINITY_DN1407_c0_g4_i2.p1 TRINITY_DN1407_c0_g4~~TRINITY_DN1407_c0_g4_i2.p1  ORF type:complete len:209 (+),score=57.81 TRINITY_DN1407_c0_g4_i2:127-753(+)
MSFTKPKITYFNAFGRIETARLMLEDAGVDYEFSPITDWATQKPALADVLTFGQVPLYQDNDISLVQSQAIGRYLAKKHGFTGSNDVEAAKIDSFAEGVEEIFSRAVKVKYGGSDEDKAAGLKSLLEELPKRLAIYENILKNNSSGFLVGSKISYADLHLYWILKLVVSYSSETTPVIESFAQVKDFEKRIAARDNIKAYYDKKPYGA